MPGLPTPLPLLTRGSSARRINKSTRCAPTATRLPSNQSSCKPAAECVHKCFGKCRAKSGTQGPPRPSRPVASTTCRASMNCVCTGVVRSSSMRPSALGATLLTRCSLRTSSASTLRYQRRYSAHCKRGILSSAAQPVTPNCASYQARKVSAGKRRSTVSASAGFPCAL